MILLALGVRFVFFKVKEEQIQSAGDQAGAVLGRFLDLGPEPDAPRLLGCGDDLPLFEGDCQLTPILAIPFGVFAAAGIALWGLMMVTLLKRYRSRLPKRCSPGR